MKYCPITYQPIEDSQSYSAAGLKKLTRPLTHLEILPFTAKEQRREASLRAGKMSLQGVQFKLSAVLHIAKGSFKLVDHGGTYILKPQSEIYEELPENEAITMTLAERSGIEVPIHGLVYSKDSRFTYFIRRYDRIGHKEKVPVEDFAQLSGQTRETKYRGSMEGIAKIIEKFCTFPVIEFAKLFERVLFNYLTGNEDMHLKNFSLISRNQKVELAPAYDFLNTTLAVPTTTEELALPLNGKKSNLTRKDFIDYFGNQYLALTPGLIEKILGRFAKALPQWAELIAICFLSEKNKQAYLHLLKQRTRKLGIN